MQGSILTWHWFLAQSHHQAENQLHAPRLISYDTEDGITPATINKKRQGETLGAVHTTITALLVIVSI